MSDFPNVQYRVDEGVAWVILDRPEVGNATDATTLLSLAAAIDDAAADSAVRALVLAAEGKNFLAGADLDSLDRISRTPASVVQTDVYGRAQSVARRLFNFPKPTVAALHGAILTMGCEFALCCDFRIVATTAMFQERWIHMGTLPALGGLKLLPAIVGLARAKEIALLGARLTAEEMRMMGLANEVVDQADLRPAAQRWALRLAQIDPDAYRETKNGLHRGLESSMDTVLGASALAQGMLLTSDAFRTKLAKVRADQEDRRKQDKS